jgi:archaellum component FlaG (FlaF/FlaG flagellin family)
VRKLITFLLALLIVGSLAGCNLDANVELSPGAADTTDDYKTNVNPNVADINNDNDKRGPADRMATEW